MVAGNVMTVGLVAPRTGRRGVTGARPACYGGLGLLGLGSMITLILPSPLRAVVGVVILLGVPGAAVTCFLRLRSVATEVLLVVVISAAVTVVGGYAMLGLHLWFPRLWSVVIATGAGAVLVAQSAFLGWSPALPPGPAPVGAPELVPKGWRRWFRSYAALVALCTAALTLWAVSVPAIHPTSADDAGLIGDFPVTFFLALASLTVAFALVLRGTRPRPMEWAVVIGLLVVVLYATTPLIATLPRYTYVYKHLGVASYLDIHGVTQPSLDIYQNWPGFFALVAVLERFAGVSGLTLAAWGQLVFALADALAVRYVVRGLTSDERVVVLSTWLYVLFDWVGQNYLSPQAFGFTLVLTTVGVLLHHRADPRPHPAGDGRLARWAGLNLVPPLPEPEGHAAPRQAVVGILILLSAAVVASHQLSPFMLMAFVGILLVTRRVRGWWLLATLIVLTAAQYVRALPYLQANNLLFSGLFDLTANSSGTSGSLPASSGHLLVEHAARVLSIGIWVGAALGVFVLRRRGSSEVTVASLLVVPFVLLVLQSYGGEAVYRVYLFTTPWSAYLVASALVGERRRRGAHDQQRLAQLRRRRTRQAGSVVLASAVLIPLWLTSFYGLYRSDYVRPSELAGWDWFASHAPVGSVLDYVCGNFPSNATGNYDSFELPDGGGGISLVNQPGLEGRELTAADIPVVISLLHISALSGPVYLVLSAGQAAYADAFGLSPPGSVARFQTILAANPNFRTVFHQGTTTLLELLPAPPTGS